MPNAFLSKSKKNCLQKYQILDSFQAEVIAFHDGNGNT